MAKFFFIYFFAALFFLNDTAFADRRNYVWAYQYNTLSQGETEFEFYQTTYMAEKDLWEYRIEIEHGLTNHLDFSVYQIFRQVQGEAFKWDAVQFRFRYRFGEAGQYFVDPLLYIEYSHRLDNSQPRKLEFRVVLGKQLGGLNIAVNPLYEYIFSPGSIHEAGLDIGLSYAITSNFLLGIESISRMVFSEGGNEKATFLGPTLSVSSGEWWYNIGVGFGFNRFSDNLRIRFIMGLEL